MGATCIEGVLAGPTGTRATVRFLVDSGATYSLVPDPVWRDLGLEAMRSVAFVLADGTRIERDVGECTIELSQGSGTSPVILGQPGDEPLLGSITLAVLDLALNPFTRELHPMRMLV